jgi:hypothetical protein
MPPSVNPALSNVRLPPQQPTRGMLQPSSSMPLPQSNGFPPQPPARGMQSQPQPQMPNGRLTMPFQQPQVPQQQQQPSARPAFPKQPEIKTRQMTPQPIVNTSQPRVNSVPTMGGGGGGGGHAVVGALTGLIQQLRGVSMRSADSKKLADCEQRLGVLSTQLGSSAVAGDALNFLTEMANNIARGDLKSAESVHRNLVTQCWTGNGQWLSGIKTILGLKKRYPQ